MKESSRTDKSIKNVSFALITQVTTIILNYICRWIFVKVLSQEYLGVNGLFSNILTIFSLAELGIGNAIVYAMYKPIADKNKEKIKQYMNLYKKCYTIIALVILTIGLVILPNLEFFIKDETNIPNLQFIYVLYLLDSVFSYLFVYKSSILNAMQKNYICNYYQIICKIVMTILMSISLIVFKNFIIYLILQITFKLITNLLISNKANKMYPYIKNTQGSNLEKKESKAIFKNVYALFCNQIGTVLINGTDNIIISKYVNLISVGIYSNYYLVLSSLTVFIGQIFTAIIASIGNFAAESNKGDTYELFKKVHFVDFIIASFCLVITSCCINTFIKLSFGEQYVLDNITVAVILINFYLLSMKHVIGTFKNALGIFWDDKYCTIIRAGINIILSIVLAKICGMVGVFIGTLISDALTTFWYQPYVLLKRGFKMPLSKYLKDFAKYTIITVIEITISVLILNCININNLILKLLVEAIIGFIVFIVITIILFRKNQYFIFVKNTIMGYVYKIKKIFKKK